MINDIRIIKDKLYFCILLKTVWKLLGTIRHDIAERIGISIVRYVGCEAGGLYPRQGKMFCNDVIELMKMQGGKLHVVSVN